jgi:hypothetical protein
MLLVLAAPLLARPAGAQFADSGPDRTIDAALRARVIDGVLQRLDQGYVFPAKAKDMSRSVRRPSDRGAYDRVTSARAFADSLTADLQAVSHDKHLRVVYRSGGVPDESPDGEATPEQRREQEAFGRQVNYGLERVERLSGNVGYLEIRSFGFTAAQADSALAAAMGFLARTDALIIDVRRNGGGDPDMVAAVCSYLMPPNTLINRFYWRPMDRWDEFRTKPVSGTPYGTDRPVYVLTSNHTFSGAEEFAYDIQTQRRGGIVGETTGGGAHPGGMRRVTEHFGVWVPAGRAVNPVTETNWEGTGVHPDLPVRAQDALRTAHLDALQRLLAHERDPDRRTALEEAARDLRDAQASGS